jgi:acetyl esterase/lipase
MLILLRGRLSDSGRSLLAQMHGSGYSGKGALIRDKRIEERRQRMSFSNPERSIPNSSTPGRVLRVAYGSDARQFGELYLPDRPGPYPAVVLIHGGFWRAPYELGLMTGLAVDLATRGIAAWNIAYRRIGDPGGGWPETLLDVARATDYLRILASNQRLDLQRTVAIGHSAGGHLALWLAARPRIARRGPLASASLAGQHEGAAGVRLAGAISLAGVADLQLGWQLRLSRNAVAELLGGGPDEVPERYAVASPAALLPLGVPQILVHGTKDESVPVAISRAYAQAALAAGDPVTLIELPDVDHFALIDRHAAAWATTVAALQRLLTQL